MPTSAKSENLAFATNPNQLSNLMGGSHYLRCSSCPKGPVINYGEGWGGGAGARKRFFFWGGGLIFTPPPQKKRGGGCSHAEGGGGGHTK